MRSYRPRGVVKDHPPASNGQPPPVKHMMPSRAA